MKAVVHEGPRQVSVRDVPDARIERLTDVLVRITSASLIGAGKAEPSFIVSHELPLEPAPEAYEHVDRRDDGWTKVVLHPTSAGARAEPGAPPVADRRRAGRRYPACSGRSLNRLRDELSVL